MTDTLSKYEYTPLEQEVTSNIMRHAMREIRLAGINDKLEVDGYMDMLQTFVDMGHSGGSAPHFIHTLVKLLNQENLMPLTNAPGEWQLVDPDIAGRPNFYQNTRMSRAFSTDGGRTYRIIGDTDDEGNVFTYTAKEAN